MIYQSARTSVQIFIIILLTAVYGQSQLSVPADPTRGNENTFKDARNRSNELERIRRVEVSPRESAPQLNLPEINEDFGRIQIINTEKIQRIAANGNTDLKQIVKASKEVRKRALRLKKNLFPLDTDDSESALNEDFSVKNFNALIIALDNSIYHFVTNPLFKNLKLLETENAQKAQEELKKIILISQNIERIAAKLSAQK